MANKKHDALAILTESGVMLALSIVLSLVTIYKMPMGGRITLLSMLPVSLLSVKHGLKAGLPTAFLFSLFQLIQDIAGGGVFVYTKTTMAVIICVLFDYLLPFTALGIAGIFRNLGKFGVVSGIVAGMLVRLCCHFVSGVFIWGQWAPAGMSRYLYSLTYNGQYMLPEIIITTVAATILINIPQIQKLLDIKVYKKGGDTVPEEEEKDVPTVFDGDDIDV